MTSTIVARFQPLNQYVCLVANYPLLQELAPQNETPWESRQNTVTYVGALSLERGVREMVQAMTCLPSSLQARLILGGNFDSRQRRDDVSHLPGWAAVDELGRIGRAQVAGLLSTAKVGLVVLHPTSSYLEVWPTKMFEYMAAGIPFIASDFPKWREIVETEQCGLFVDPLDPGAIARAIEYLLTHPAEAQAMGRRGRMAVERRFSWQSQQEKLLGLYADLLGTRT
ncbi:MAG: glycosyltransferase [Chloroflexi bacterium]|nr:glycosyltransferase [Chloroflexota bacterium]